MGQRRVLWTLTIGGCFWFGAGALPLPAFARDPSGAASAQIDGADASERVAARPLLARLLAELRAGAGMAAEFVQVNRWVVFDEPDTARGQLTVAFPNRFRLEYSHPPGHLVGSDGRHVWTFLPDERQVLRAELDETTGWVEFFFRGLEQPADSLARLYEHPRWGTVAVAALWVRPQWGLRDLYVELRLSGGLPVGYGYTDEEGNRVSFQFDKVALPESVDSGLFDFAVPDGYELFETGR